MTSNIIARSIEISTVNPKPIVECPEMAMFELKSRRTRNGKSFRLFSGLNRQIITIGHQHYWDGSEWQEIDNRVVKTEFGFECFRTSYFWQAHQTGIGCNYKSRLGGFSRMKLLHIGNNEVGYSVNVTPDDNCLHYSAVALDTDFHWQLLPSKISGWITLHSDDAPREWVWEFIHSDKVVIARSRQGIDAKGRKLEIECDIETSKIKDGLYRTILTKRWTGRVSTRDPVTRQREWTEDVVYPVAIDPDISEQIIAIEDDGYEYDSTWYNADSGPAIGEGVSYNLYHAGWRFQTVAVPLSGDTIDLANFKIYQLANTDPAIATLFGDDVDDSAAWATASRPTLRAKTTASTYVPESYGAAHDTIHVVTAIIQEIVDRGGWATGNDISLFMIGDINNTGDKTGFYQYAENGKHGRLEIDYSSIILPIDFATKGIFKDIMIRGITNTDTFLSFFD